MANVKDNRRVHYTKAALRQSLISHLKKKPIDRITVKEICETADLNRGTFYAYYGSPAEMLGEIENSFYEDILSSVTAFRKAEDVVTIFTQALTAIKERYEFSEALFGEYGDITFLQQLLYVAKPTCLHHWAQLAPELSKAEMDDMYDFASYGCMRVIQMWIQGGAEREPNQVALFLNDICNNGILGKLKR